MFRYRYHLREPAFSLIKEGKKIFEGRLFKNTFKNIRPNDVLCFYNNQRKTEDSYLIQVLNTYKYETFSLMLISKGIKNVTPLSKSLNDSINIYRKYYSQEDEKKYGVIAIKLKVLES